jgi:hypothetical protein
MDEVSISASFSSLVKPTVETPFHIDYGWWERENLDLGVELRSHLCPEHQAAFNESFDPDEKIDWVDEETGEVRRVNGVQHVMRVHCSKQPGYVAEHLSLIDAVFRVFLSRGNKPLSCKELSNIIGVPAERILRTLSGGRVYKGIRPFHS